MRRKKRIRFPTHFVRVEVEELVWRRFQSQVQKVGKPQVEIIGRLITAWTKSLEGKKGELDA